MTTRIITFLVIATLALMVFFISPSHDGDNTQPVIEAVDLGLSVKWASCNVDAARPERSGEYFFKKDVVSGVNRWGAPWRLPNVTEITELKEKCTWTWMTVNDRKGYKVTGPNGNSIFLPAAGYVDEELVEDFNALGYYWATIPTTFVKTQKRLWFYSAKQEGFWVTEQNDDLPIRLVCE